eukprot:1079292-Prymnesium_polylepis.1
MGSATGAFWGGGVGVASAARTRLRTHAARAPWCRRFRSWNVSAVPGWQTSGTGLMAAMGSHTCSTFQHTRTNVPSDDIYVGAPYEGTCLRIPAGMAVREGGPKRPRAARRCGISPCRCRPRRGPFRSLLFGGIMANGSQARAPPYQWARGPGIHQRYSRR